MVKTRCPLWLLWKVLEDEVFLNLLIEMEMVFCTLCSVSFDARWSSEQSNKHTLTKKSFIPHKHMLKTPATSLLMTGDWSHDRNSELCCVVRVVSLQQNKHETLTLNVCLCPTEKRKHNAEVRREEKNPLETFLQSLMFFGAFWHEWHTMP